MSLMAIYITAACIGAGLIALTLLVGGDHDADIDSPDAEGDAGFDAAGWLPFASLRFWTFFSAAFGLTGIGLSALDLSRAPSIIFSVGAGYVSGLFVSKLYLSLIHI